jgi:hypothetical protein
MHCVVLASSPFGIVIIYLALVLLVAAMLAAATLLRRHIEPTCPGCQARSWNTAPSIMACAACGWATGPAAVGDANRQIA